MSQNHKSPKRLSWRARRALPLLTEGGRVWLIAHLKTILGTDEEVQGLMKWLGPGVGPATARELIAHVQASTTQPAENAGSCSDGGGVSSTDGSGPLLRQDTMDKHMRAGAHWGHVGKSTVVTGKGQRACVDWPDTSDTEDEGGGDVTTPRQPPQIPSPPRQPPQSPSPPSQPPQSPSPPRQPPQSPSPPRQPPQSPPPRRWT